MGSKILRYFLLAFICLFLASCSRKDVAPLPVSEITSGIAAGDFAPGQLEAHYLKHRHQFGNITQEEYLNNARFLLNAPPGKDILEKIRPNGDILHYRLSTGEFAVMSSDGRMRTYFKADYQYWMRQ